MTSIRQRAARLAPYFRDGRSAWAVAVAASLVIAGTEVMTAKLMKPLIDQGFRDQAIPYWLIPLVIVGVFVARGLATFTAQYALAWSTSQSVIALRRAMFSQLQRAAPGLFSKYNASNLTNTVVYEVQNGAQLITSAVNTLLKDSLTLAGLLVSLLLQNWRLTLLVLVMVPTTGWVMRTASKRLRRLTDAGQKATDDLAYVMEENVLAWRIVRLHGASEGQTARFDSSNLSLRRILMKSVAAGAAITPLTQVLASFALSMVVVAALWQSRSSQATAGDFISFITAMLMLITPIKHLTDVMAPIARGMSSLERCLDLIETNPLEQSGSHTQPKAQGALQLQRVSLRYKDDQLPALDDVTLDVPAGQTVALVGPSGAGKSSLVHLLPRFIEPTEGQVLLDGVPLQDWQVDSLRQQFALVSQDVVLFNDSVAANVALGAEPDLARVRSALQGANLLDFVQALPQGLDTPVGHNGNQLSGGQRQRLAIARAIYKDASILILDEATSALDAESEHLVQQALDRLMQGRTTLVIAHRLATIERADRIVVMDAGRIVEQGPHRELLAAGGLYARLHAMQFRS
ncbi:MAG: lipid A export permease/ATP-binding protein MsbA [Vitreoscilla sp.]|nr:lipid A export permease/ATP-binding protein MsbA [Vitreoscilla sp.]MBP6675692.1 lipid A export permease/ATP-binding protein MsbA [Vitreoscilla sp.]